MLPDNVVETAISTDLPRLTGRFEGFSEAMNGRMLAVERNLKKVLEDMKARPEEGIQLTISLRWRRRPGRRHLDGDAGGRGD